MPAPHDNHASEFPLRLSADPYKGLALILGVVTLITVIPTRGKYDWGFLEADLIGWIVFFLPLVFLDTRYRIWWKNGTIVQRAANYAITEINVKDITSIKSEISDVKTLLSLRRPFRRIAIYDEKGKEIKWIDVSLKHFKQEDIRALMELIQERRPDLKVPMGSVQDADIPRGT